MRRERWRADELAAMFGVSERFIYDQAAAGVLPSYRVGSVRLFTPDAVRVLRGQDGVLAEVHDIGRQR